MSDIVENASPAAQQLYSALVNRIQRFGMFEEQRKKTSVHLSRRSAFAGVQFRREYLILTLKSERPIESERVGKSEQLSRNRWHCEIKVGSAAELDPELMRWMRDAYELCG
jgi:Domain of unknown function (DUF5655)